MTGRVIIVTGSNTGIGYEVAKQLAEGGNDVVLACRDESKAASAVSSIKAELPNSLIQYMKLDLSSMSSIREFVKDFMHKKRKLDVLVNNAAILLGSKDLTRKITSDGHELTMATNYFGLFLLTSLLLEYMVQTASITGDGRIINITCDSHDPENTGIGKGCMDVDITNLQLENEGTYSTNQAYKNSKACGLMFTYFLSKQIRGSKVTVNSVNPGYVPKSSLLRHASKFKKLASVCCIYNGLRCVDTKTEKKAAQDVVSLIISDKYEGRTGKYYINGVEERSSIETYDVDTQKALWSTSCRLLNFRSHLVDEDMDNISLGEKADSPLLRH